MVKGKKIRVVFESPPDFAPTANVWVEADDAVHPTKVRLLHDYPDLKPEAGWHLTDGKTSWQVKAVADGWLTLTATPTEDKPDV